MAIFDAIKHVSPTPRSTDPESERLNLLSDVRDTLQAASYHAVLREMSRTIAEPIGLGDSISTSSFTLSPKLDPSIDGPNLYDTTAFDLTNLDPNNSSSYAMLEELCSDKD